MTFGIAAGLHAQGTADDYRRAFDAPYRFSADRMYYAPIAPQWVGHTHHFWYRRHTPEGDVYVVVDADNKQRAELFDTARLGRALREQAGYAIDSRRLRLERLEVNDGLDTLRFRHSGSRWMYVVGSDKLTRLGAIPQPGRQRHWMEVDDERGAGPVTSPNGRYTAFVRDCNLYVRRVADGKERQLSFDGHLYTVGARQPAHFHHPYPSGGREALCVLCGVVPPQPVAAHATQAGICQAR